MEMEEENSVLMMQSLGINNTEDFSDEKNQLQHNREDETQLVKSFNDLLLQLNLRLVEKDELLEKYRNENKLLKGRLKGYETLAALYAQSKLINSQLRAQCDEQRTLLEQRQTDGQFPSTIHAHSTEISRGEGEKFSEAPERHFGSFEVIDPDQNKVSSSVETATPLQNDLKDDPTCHIEESGKTGGADEEVEKPPKESGALCEIPFLKCTVDEGCVHLSEGCGHLCETDEDRDRCLKQNEADSGTFEIMELNAFERYLKDVNSSNELKDLLMELLMVGMKIIGLENQLSDDEDKEHHSNTAKVSIHQLCEQLASCLKPGSSTKVSTTQARDVEGKVASQANNGFAKQLLTGDVGCLMNEIQILQSQALTFKNDFERERKDLEKIRSKYETMKKQYSRLTAEYSVHKVQLRELQLGQARKKEATMNQHMNMAATRLSAFQPSVGLCHLHANPFSPPKWLCIRCTFENCSAGKICEMCGLDRSRLRNKRR